MSYSFSDERLPGTPEEDLAALFTPPPLLYSLASEDVAAAESEVEPGYDDSTPPLGWVDVDIDAKFLQFGDRTVVPLSFVDRGKLALSRYIPFTDWTAKALPVGVHMLTLLCQPWKVTLARGLRPFKASDTSSHIRLQLNWLGIMGEERLVFCRNGSEMSVTGGPSAPATLRRIGQRVATEYLKFFRDHSTAPDEVDPALGHIHFSQLYLVALYTYDAQKFHADIRVAYPYAPVEDEKTTAATGTSARL